MGWRLLHVSDCFLSFSAGTLNVMSVGFSNESLPSVVGQPLEVLGFGICPLLHNYGFASPIINTKVSLRATSYWEDSK